MSNQAHIMCRNAATYLYEKYVDGKPVDRSILRAVNLLDLASNKKWRGMKI